ncbi:3-oxoacyl-[acyl-carrier-protein] synthase III C-terminal domain-containing protein [Shewanella sp. NIFS-20-20]|uniref:3-oxoacyl-[acyl-carrier-protein] synthase III C-terminal domain-containing protein n=1 Tax=Shewanella sp. NIFS-20-20 TaxID=2853806 RepID=UPI001C456B0C|nr:3-oxoacyl-[acyl-carrier-protein] synthase III C-terminal domain-containing protein [Shewanella sp. NIFS-20-20]MBV7315968.1 3-oxoacyl-ACP synthase [Shewanella sp. NIFS-20-20]
MSVRFAKHSISLLGIGHALPPQGVDNAQLLAALAALTNPRLKRKAQTIANLIGVQHRYLSRRLDKAASGAEPNGIELSLTAIARMRQHAGFDTLEPCQYLISHTCTPHTQVPGNAAWIADALAFSAPYLELRQACCGFANGLQIAAAMIAADSAPIVISGSETGSVYSQFTSDFLDTDQLLNLMQMGDGAGAVMLGPWQAGVSFLSDMYLGHQGIGQSPGFYLAGGSDSVWQGQISRFHHNANAVRSMGPTLFELGLAAVLSRGYQLDDFAYILPHQANGHIDTLLSQHWQIAPERIINDAVELGNLGSAAIWVSLSRLIHSGRLRHNDKVLVLGAEATKYIYGGCVYHHCDSESQSTT